VRDEASEIEFLTWTGRVTLRLPRAIAKLERSPGAPPARPFARTAWFGEDEPREASVRRGDSIAVGESIAGPAIVEEPTSTLVLPPGSEARLSPFGTYLVDVFA
jgi:N-methylhydantoinase A